MSEALPDADLAARLDELATQLAGQAPRGTDGEPAQLHGLLPCEPVIGEVAVACWVASDGGEQFDLVRLDDGSIVDDHTALRESLTLLAMTETLEDLAGFDQLHAILDDLSVWRAGSPEGALEDDALAQALDAGIAALQALDTQAPGDHPRVARSSWLDAVGGALRVLETSWTALEQAAERWSDALLEPNPGDQSAVDRVQALWQALSGARRGSLARPASAAIHEGREAGAAMAGAIAEAQNSSS